MSGADVSDLQRFLAQDNTIYPQGLVTGYFGTLTKAAVSNFQARNGISNIGRVGPVTMAAINAQMGGGLVGSGPVIGPVFITTGNTGATMTWNTSGNSAAIIYYSTAPLAMTEASATTGVTIGGSSMLVHTDQRSTHAATLTGLLSNSTYYYVVYAKDASGNESITWPSTFRTTN